MRLSPTPWPVLRSTRDLRLARSFSTRAAERSRQAAWAAFGRAISPPAGSQWIQFIFYHWVLDDQRKAFRQQLEFFRNQGEFLTLDDAIEVLESGGTIGGRYFCITVDDGFKNGITNVAPVLEEAKAPAAFFVPTQYIGLDLEQDRQTIDQFYGRSFVELAGRFEFLNWHECRDLVAAGFTVGSHTHSHTRLASLSPHEAYDELSRSKAELELNLGQSCRHFCCPWGKPHRDFDPELHPRMAHAIGYRSFLTTAAGACVAGQSPLLVPRTGSDPEFSLAILRYALRPPFRAARRRWVSMAERKNSPLSGTIEQTEPDLVQVAKFPHPFEAAFTICSDVDGANPQRFRAVHALICSQELVRPETSDWQALGLSKESRFFDPSLGGVPGLGLDFADSFFLVSDGKAFGMYRPATGAEQLEEYETEGVNSRQFICDALKTGQIDTFHAFLHHPRRQMLPRLTEFYRWCEGEGVPKPRVWTNHSYAVTPTGLCPDRLQPNRVIRLLRLSARGIVGPLFGRRRFPLAHAWVRYRGDQPNSPYYINDILAANGLRYVWLNMDDLKRNQIALPEQAENGRPSILQPITMGDGVRYYRFNRCYGKPSGRSGGEAYLRDSADGFDSSVLLDETSLASLCRAQGTCILYTHWTHAQSVPIGDETLARLLLLKHWRDTGRVWVTSTSRLLEWTRRRTFLRVETRLEGPKLIIELAGVDDPIFGWQTATPADYHGFSFTVPAGTREIIVVVGGQVLESRHWQRQGRSCWLTVPETRSS